MHPKKRGGYIRLTRIWYSIGWRFHTHCFVLKREGKTSAKERGYFQYLFQGIVMLYVTPRAHHVLRLLVVHEYSHQQLYVRLSDLFFVGCNCSVIGSIAN